MNPTLDTDRRPEAMADVPGICELRLTRAVVQYRDAHEIDEDGNALFFRTAGEREDPEVEAVLLEAFPHADMRRSVPGLAGVAGYQVRLPLPLTLDEARTTLAGIRSGLAHLVARFEPDRFRILEPVLSTFGARETLAQLHLPGPRTQYDSVRRAVASSGPVVH
jgi:hypothetical protein